MNFKNIRSGGFTAVELWSFAVLFIFSMIAFVSSGADGMVHPGDTYNQHLFLERDVPFDYYKNYLTPLFIRYCLLFAAIIYLNFWIVPALIRSEDTRSNIWRIAFTFLGAFAVVLPTEYFVRQYLFFPYGHTGRAWGSLWQLSFLYVIRVFLVYTAYVLLKYALLAVAGRVSRYRFKSKYFGKELLVAVPIWIVGCAFFLIDNAMELFAFWLAFIPSILLFYVYTFHLLIPRSLRRKRPFLHYMAWMALCCFLLFLGVAVMFSIATRDDDTAFGSAAINGFVQYLLVAPALWLLFKRQMKGKEELYALRTELGNSTANLDLLRSQINPHFLFNALNTIYGTAIQEGAERTSEGIEKLGSMMRFMLLENTQDKIALTREIEYLSNFIALQKLRTSTSSAIRIEVDLQEGIDPMLQIAPMLLIPFVENAFKHGISLREESHIKISLEVKEATLYFDVYNTKHQRPQYDPERHSNGIGLVNVQQRLQLLYPAKHDLMIRDAGKDFYVHLILNLGK